MNSLQGVGTGLVVGAPLQHASPQSVLGKEVRGMYVDSLLKKKYIWVNLRARMFLEKSPDEI